MCRLVDEATEEDAFNEEILPWVDAEYAALDANRPPDCADSNGDLWEAARAVLSAGGRMRRITEASEGCDSADGCVLLPPCVLGASALVDGRRRSMDRRRSLSDRVRCSFDQSRLTTATDAWRRSSMDSMKLQTPRLDDAAAPPC